MNPFIETLEDRRLMSVSPCGISVSFNGNTITATQGTNVASATLSGPTISYTYSWNGQTGSGSVILK